MGLEHLCQGVGFDVVIHFNALLQYFLLACPIDGASLLITSTRVHHDPYQIGIRPVDIAMRGARVARPSSSVRASAIHCRSALIRGASLRLEVREPRPATSVCGRRWHPLP